MQDRIISGAERVERYARSGTGPVPVLVFIHGGYWRSLAKEMFHLLAPPFLEVGIAVAFVGAYFSMAQSDAELDAKYVELAIGVLEQDADRAEPSTRALRDWAVEIIGLRHRKAAAPIREQNRRP